MSPALKKKAGIVLYIKGQFQPILKEADIEGRFLLVEIDLNGKKSLLIGVYAPNQLSLQKQFYRQLHQKIVAMDYKSFIFLGDWNGVLDITKDKRTTSKVPLSRLPKSFFAMMEDLELVDVWRQQHKNECDFTFFSHRHDSFSRIDFVLISADLLMDIDKTKIFSRTLSDHSPVLVVLAQQKKRKSWRMNDLRLFLMFKGIESFLER